MIVSGTTRELACLTLGHDDAEEPRCLTPDEDLVRQLVEEVQALRVAAGLVEETETDRQQAEAALADALTEVAIAELPDEEVPAALVATLAEVGWALHPIRRR